MSGRALNIIDVDDAGDGRVAPYMNLKDAHLAVTRGETPADEAAGLFIAEGVLVVEAAIGSRYRVQSVLATPGRVESLAGMLGGLAPGTPVYRMARGAIEQAVGFDLHRGILAACERGAGLTAREVIEQSETLVVLEDLSNHDNMGGIFRNVAALAGERAGVLLSPRCCDPLYRKAIRVSMGHVLRVAFARLESLASGLEAIGAAGFDVVGLSPAASAAAIEEVEGAGRRALVLGSEGEGLSAEGRARVGRLVRIPMAPGIDSLNVSVACGIALHRLRG